MKITDENSLLKYFDFIRNIVSWFDERFLKLNITKTKELCIEGQRTKDPTLLRHVQIGSENVDQVDSFKYLGIVIDTNLTFSNHVDAIIKKSNQRLYLLRKLRSFNVSSHVMSLVYNSIIQSILSFNIVSWFGHIRVKDKTRLNRVVNIASKIIGKKQKSLPEICPFGEAFVLHDSGLSNMGLHQNVVMQMFVLWGLSTAMISSLHNNFHLLETEEKSPEVGVCLPMWRGN